MAYLEFKDGGLMKELRELEKRLSNDISKKALNEGGEIILKEMQKLVPKKEWILHDSLCLHSMRGNVHNETLSVKIGIHPSMYEAVKYGFYQEYGTANMLGKFWMKRAWISKCGSANKKITEVIQSELKLRRV